MQVWYTRGQLGIEGNSSVFLGIQDGVIHSGAQIGPGQPWKEGHSPIGIVSDM